MATIVFLGPMCWYVNDTIMKKESAESGEILLN